MYIILTKGCNYNLSLASIFWHSIIFFKNVHRALSPFQLWMLPSLKVITLKIWLSQLMLWHWLLYKYSHQFLSFFFFLSFFLSLTLPHLAYVLSNLIFYLFFFFFSFNLYHLTYFPTNFLTFSSSFFLFLFISYSCLPFSHVFPFKQSFLFLSSFFVCSFLPVENRSYNRFSKSILWFQFLNTFVHLNLFDKTQEFIPQVFETGCKPILF